VPQTVCRDREANPKPITTGKHMIVVRYNFCRALSIGRTAKPLFAVRFSKGARQTITHGFRYVCRAFYT
jgi:hypothetical protein